jgi:hypothetical protein
VSPEFSRSTEPFQRLLLETVETVPYIVLARYHLAEARC